MAFEWYGMTDAEREEMKQAFEGNIRYKVANIVWTGISILPFIWVMIATKSACARLCLFLQMTINFLGSLIMYILTIVGCYMWVGYIADQIAEGDLEPEVQVGFVWM